MLAYAGVCGRTAVDDEEGCGMLMMGSAHTINVEAVVFVLDEILPGTSAYVQHTFSHAFSIRQHT
jgi:hypothetical protein